MIVNGDLYFGGDGSSQFQIFKRGTS